tara:strand:- start:124 stop:348 length:225 start_codon:yes stop_codon:yes gene_type:complete
MGLSMGVCQCFKNAYINYFLSFFFFFFFINTRYGTTSGTITLNGTKDRISNHRDIMGFVPQGKCFYKSLFVIKN